MQRILAKLPPSLVRAVGRWQFRFPPVRWLVERLAGRLTRRDTIIAGGVGAGLRFNATGGNPGYLLGTSEPQEQEFLRAHLPPGGVFYDIGANVGFFSTLAGRLVGPAGSVWAFEPFPESAERARSNAHLNGFAHVTVTEAAVAAERGTMTLGLAERTTKHHLTDGGPGLRVDVVSIDGWRAETAAPGPDLVMIDVEGAEIDVLRGMTDVLRECRPAVICEVHYLGDRFHDFVRTHLEPLRYRIASLEGPVPAGNVRWHAVLTPLDGSGGSGGPGGPGAVTGGAAPAPIAPPA